VTSLRPSSLIALALPAVLAAAAPVTASAKKPRRYSWNYSVTARAEMKESWSYSYETAYPDIDGSCTDSKQGSGSASIQLRTPRPQPMMVNRGSGRRPPMVGVGSDPYVVLRGPYLRQGSMVDEHGGTCAAGNPPRTWPTTGCGRQSFDIELGFAWEQRGTLRPSTSFSVLRENCPMGPPNVRWDGDESPSLMKVLTHVGPSKFLGTKQFTISGSRTFHGVVPPTDRSGPDGSYFREHGEHTVTWKWEATFRLDKPKKPRKRRHG
jgi:hypothetical protein